MRTRHGDILLSPILGYSALTLKARIGCSRPFTVNSPMGSKRKALPAAFAVFSETSVSEPYC